MCEGPFPDDLYNDALSLGPTLTSRGGDMDWNMLGSGGEVASLMSLVSNHEVKFEMDVNVLPALKMFGSVLNTRKMGELASGTTTNTAEFLQVTNISNLASVSEVARSILDSKRRPRCLQ